ncbi:hypothetical protein [Catenovulum adriaticum]|uniref:Uncharacterized protein n=1 Tax=Catenovulum adriaticum TaxID=2984846 RepID=A0ABY7AIV7_9ALTE|nr:hypothetical protein [Catenovulum sp. TS8]WAJ69530.1 hypothetical protein OLW01_10140 [Catenovulum sp. TS8]
MDSLEKQTKELRKVFGEDFPEHQDKSENSSNGRVKTNQPAVSTSIGGA